MRKHPEEKASLPDLLGIGLLAGLLFFVSLGARDLWNPNEPTYGKAVAEMAERGDWLIPTVNDKVFAEKPILYYWAALVSAKLLGGVDELSLRLPSALAGLGSVLLTYLLVAPYAGTRRALLAAALCMTSYQVFWASRAVQMDVLVLASALGVLVPLSRFLDFGARPAPAFLLAGLAAGLGFLAKGPVAWVLPGIVITAYTASTGRLRRLLRPEAVVAAAVALAISAPWYLLLWLQGESAFLQEVLLRQNVGRFLDAWDHRQPWWYFLKYLWIDYAPWALLLPAAAWMRAETEREARLHRLSWLWIFGIILFFSLSESKRAPYILPIAPAVAVLASGVVDRWIRGGLRERAARGWAAAAFELLALLLLALGVAVWTPALEVPGSLAAVARVFGILLPTVALAVGCGVLLARRRPSLAPLSLLAGFAAFYLIGATWALPAANPLKSARVFAKEMNARLAATHGSVASYRFWDWRSGCAYYAQRSVPNLQSPADLGAYWRSGEAVHVLAEDGHEAEVRTLLADARIVQQSPIGSRRTYLFAKALRSLATFRELGYASNHERGEPSRKALYLGGSEVLGGRGTLGARTGAALPDVTGTHQPASGHRR